jgi:hypothetical protein
VLFVALGIEICGYSSSRGATVVAGDVPPAHREDLLNVAVIHTLINRGTVYAVPPSQMPDAASMAALFRY